MLDSLREESTVLDALDRSAATIVDECATLIPQSDKTAALNAKAALDFQWITGKGTNTCDRIPIVMSWGRFVLLKFCNIEIGMAYTRISSPSLAHDNNNVRCHFNVFTSHNEYKLTFL